LLCRRLICRHEPLLSGTTDADLKFPERITNYTIDGELIEGVFACDLTLEEIKTLRAVQSNALRDPQYNGLFEVSHSVLNVTLHAFLLYHAKFVPRLRQLPVLLSSKGVMHSAETNLRAL
jgi:hypothetical protein